MNAADLEPFDDPGLKASLRRALAGERAPEALRRRLSDLVARESATPAPAPALAPTSIPTRRSRPPRPPRPVFRSLTWAAAAVVMIGVGTIGYLAFHRPAPAYAALPATLASALVARHDACCSGPWRHQDPALPQNNFNALGRALRQKLDHSVLVADLAKDDWTFRGAAICPVGDCDSGHLIFERTVPAGSTTSAVKQELSIVSLPTSLWPDCPAGSRCEVEVAGHPIVALQGKGGLYCLVGSSPDHSLKAADLEKTLTQHQAEVATLRPEREAKAARATLVAELLYDRP